VGRRRGGGKRARGGLRSGVWLVAGACLLVGGLVVGAHLFDQEMDAGSAPALEGGDPAEPPATWDRIRVEVLNGAGVPGLAARARDRLREEGFDVVYYGNAPSFDQETTVVLARTEPAGAARAVAGRLGVTRVELAPDSARFVDVTVLLGPDWPGEPPDEADPSDAGGVENGETPWWDLRGLLMPRDRDGT